MYAFHTGLCEMLSPRFTTLLLLLLCLLNVTYIWLYARTVLIDEASGASYSYRGHDFPAYLPLPTELGWVMMTVEESVHYKPLGASSEDAWRTITSPGYGYVRLGPEDRTFAVSMFHELHCLRMINRAFSKMPGATPAHLQHCLNYLRQNILCTPDLTLEPGDFEERDFGVERSGGTHECKDWKVAYDFVNTNFDLWKNRTGFVELPTRNLIQTD